MKIESTIYEPRELVKLIRNKYGIKVSEASIHWLAGRLGYGKKRFGGKYGYARSLSTDILRHFNELVDYDKAHQQKRAQKPQIDYNPDKFIEPEGKKDYAWESKISKYITEAIDELELFHGSPHEFDKFDFAYMSSGWGQQLYGYGAYLTDELECAKEYSQGGHIYTVEIPDKKYLSYGKISSALAMKIARVFFNYYMTEDEYGREAYAGCENEFWENECKYIGECYDGGTLYGTISSLLGSDKGASKFLLEKMGYTGLYWVATNGATGKKFKNYVIFDPNAIKILKRE